MNKNRRLIWLCPEFTPYQQVLFSAVASAADISLRVEVMMPNAGTHPFEPPKDLPYRWTMADQNCRVDRKLISRVLAEEDAEVVVSSYLRPTLWAAMRALVRRGRRFLYWSDTPLQQRIQWNHATPQRRSLVRTVARNRLLKWIYRHAYRVMVTGYPGVLSSIHLGCPVEKAVCFPYWVELDVPTPGPKVQTRRNIVALGQLIYRKGYDVALEAFARAAGTGLPEDIRLVLAGDGESRKSLEQQAEKLGIASRVDFPGWLNMREKQNLFDSAGVLVHPARWEPYGVVVLEAMAAGIAVLGSDQTMAAVDRVTDGVSGLLHTTGNAVQLAGQFKQVYANSETLCWMGQRARETAQAWPPQRSVDILRNLLWNTA